MNKSEVIGLTLKLVDSALSDLGNKFGGDNNKIVGIWLAPGKIAPTIIGMAKVDPNKVKDFGKALKAYILNAAPALADLAFTLAKGDIKISFPKVKKCDII